MVDVRLAHALIEPSSSIDDEEIVETEHLWCILDYGWLSDGSRSESPLQPSPFPMSGWGLFEDLIGNDLFFPSGHESQTGVSSYQSARLPAVQAANGANERDFWYSPNNAGSPSGHGYITTPKV